ncbi:Na+/H+ antiporter NhaC family protein [Candidatus Cetobacterium colombiensis]|uniref:Na+/H+ antiporter NhaC family protein n=1 Tax=Candidatus Cetobacterium colombiensis TaxID=3073100 RepID=A0ABU4WC24_9FUSO|nr:Na+/H+ antiporter NhaC family protein [Candidatus Cetobacterium colombiensis]MDX8337079.1 Na+/H+ antiporter NhaC family protein [Candidatus Cetobacterium colombiensis]
MNIKAKGDFRGLIPFLVFIGFYLGSGVILDSMGVELAFYQLPAPVAIFPGIIVAFLIFKGTIKEKFETFLEGCGHQDIITMCIIYLLAGGFAIVSKSMGGVESTVNLGLTYIPSHYIAPGLFVIAGFISTATGTSVGSIVSLAPIAVGLADKSGVSMPLVLAALMGGAMFGDNLSIISDTTIAATRTQGVEMKDKFRVNIKIAAPAAFLTLILLIVFGKPDVATESGVYAFNIIKVLPYIFVLTLSLIGINVFVVLTAGIGLSGAIGLFYGDFTWLGYAKEIYNGFTGMTEIFLLSLLTGGLASLVTKAGGVDWIMSTIEKRIKGVKSAQIGMGLLVTLTDMAVANNTVAIIINGPIAKKISDRYKVDPKKTASVLDIFSCITQGAIPYGAQMLIMLSFAEGKVSPFDIIPLLWYQMILAIFTIGYIFYNPKES